MFKNKGDVYMSKPWLRLYSEGVPSELILPNLSIPQAFDQAVEKWKNRTCVVFYGNKISYLELKDHIDRFATALYNIGVRKGDVVALHLVNSPQYIIAYFGAIKAGAVVTPISPVYVSSEVKYQLEDSQAKVLVCQDFLHQFVVDAGVKLDSIIYASIGDYLPRVLRVLGKGVLKNVYRKMELPSLKIYEKEGTYQFKELIKKYPPNPPKLEFNPKEDVALLPYSGGTTGFPKGVMLTHYNILAQETGLRAMMPSLIEGKEVIIAYMPFYHIAGITSITHGILRGFTLVVITSPVLDDIITYMESYKVTMFFGSPGIYELLSEFPKTNRANWGRIKIILCGAESLLEETRKKFEAKTRTVMQDGYGLTESSGIIALQSFERVKLGTFGFPVPSSMVAVINHDTLEFVSPEEIGELIITGPSIMKGYWNNAEETEKAFVEIDGNKWLRTGDLVKMNEEGEFFFYDRIKDIIKYKGYQVYARQVEEVLGMHPMIKEVGVFGVPDTRVGQNIKAVIVLEREVRGQISEAEIMEYCEGKLAHYKIPKIIEFRGEIPKTDVGKVSRRELRDE